MKGVRMPLPARIEWPQAFTFVLHQDNLLWSRLQTMQAIQVASLAAGYSLAAQKTLALGVVLLGSFLTVLLFGLLKRDELIRDQVMKDYLILDWSAKPRWFAPLRGGTTAWVLLGVLLFADGLLATEVARGAIPGGLAGAVASPLTPVTCSTSPLQRSSAAGTWSVSLARPKSGVCRGAMHLLGSDGALSGTWWCQGPSLRSGTVTGELVNGRLLLSLAVASTGTGPLQFALVDAAVAADGRSAAGTATGTSPGDSGTTVSMVAN
jgi:hypothetical protein